MTIRKKLAGAVCALLVTVAVLGACSQSESAGNSSSGGAGASGQPTKLLWVGDSIAKQLEKPLSAAAEAGGLKMKSIASTGGGNVAGRDKLAKSTFENLSKALESFHPDVVAYQVSTYDWGTEKKQRAAYQNLLDEVTGAGARLAFVTMPPIKPDDFYAKHMDELNRTDQLVKEVAASSNGKAVAFDSTQVWGETFQQRRGGKLFRAPDGVHTCPQGAAQFTSWFMDNLGQFVSGFTPAPAKNWANAGWSGSEEFKDC